MNSIPCIFSLPPFITRQDIWECLFIHKKKKKQLFFYIFYFKKIYTTSNF